MSTERSGSSPQSVIAPPPKRTATPRERPLRLRVHGWLRWLHIYISMFSLLAILFFSLTGITLNHPDWEFTQAQSERVTKGQLPAGWKKGGKVDWFIVTEYLRSKSGVHGIAKPPAEEDESISFSAPGYSADCSLEMQTGAYELSVRTQGFFGVMNDFHRGTDAGTGWKRLIDVSGILLAIVALTGLGLLYYLKKVRVAAVCAMFVGAALVVILMKLASS